MNVSLRQLQAFVAVVQFGSFVQAARSMALTQAALSHLVRELEGASGIRLLHRTTRSVQLSKEGEIFLPYVQRVLAGLDSAALCASALRDGKLGVVRIATTHLLAATRLPPLIVAYQAQKPGIQIVLSDVAADDVITRVGAGHADLALGPERPAPEDMVAQHVFSDRLMLVCSPRYRLASRQQVRWQELANEPLIMSGQGVALRMMADLNYTMKFEATRYVEHFTTLLALVANDQGVGVSTTYVSPFLPMYGLRMIPLVGPVVRRRVMLYSNAAHASSAAAEDFSVFLMQQLGGAGQELV